MLGARNARTRYHRTTERSAGENQENVDDEGILQYLRLVEEPEEMVDKEGKSVWKGLSYSDVLMMLKWYNVLPR